MILLYFVLLLAATVCFALATFDVVAGRINLIAGGLFCWVLVLLLQTLQRL